MIFLTISFIYKKKVYVRISYDRIQKYKTRIHRQNGHWTQEDHESPGKKSASQG